MKQIKSVDVAEVLYSSGLFGKSEYRNVFEVNDNNRMVIVDLYTKNYWKRFKFTYEMVVIDSDLTIKMINEEVYKLNRLESNLSKNYPHSENISDLLNK